VNVELRHVKKDKMDLWLRKMAVAADRDSLVVGRGLSSVLDSILEVEEASEVVIVGVGVVLAVLVGRDQQIQGSPGGIDCNIAVDYART
jgi:hypothetical protein